MLVGKFMGKIVAIGETPEKVKEIARLRGYSPSEIKIFPDNKGAPKNKYINHHYYLKAKRR